MQKNYRNILNDLNSLDGVKHSFVISRDGLLIYPEECKDINPEAFAAMAATILGAAEAAMDELNGGVPAVVVAKAKKDNIIITGAGPMALLAVVSSSDDIDAVHKAMESASKEIGKNTREK
ncbi:MAG: hypothetical protein GWP10_09335 [Nitrospiraceae bacterium]|nr:hypothetical protein [Nitrospiraceae bacterium]